MHTSDKIVHIYICYSSSKVIGVEFKVVSKLKHTKCVNSAVHNSVFIELF